MKYGVGVAGITMTLCLLAHFFLVRQQQRLKNPGGGLTVPQVQLLLSVVLPRQEFDADWVLEVLDDRRRRNHTAYWSHRKRQLARLNQLE